MKKTNQPLSNQWTGHHSQSKRGLPGLRVKPGTKTFSSTIWLAAQSPVRTDLRH